LSYRNTTPNNDHSGTHGDSFNWNIFCELSLEELGELQNKSYYTEKSTGQIKDRTGQRVAYDHSTKKVETTTRR
jgi:adenylylsulfate kinase-like enzyme